MAIKAGDIVWVVRASVDKLNQGLNQAESMTAKFGKSVLKHSRAIGIGMTAMGAVITGALFKTVSSWAEYGDAVAKAAKRTGLSTEAISIFRHAAEQSGTGVEAMETAVKRMASTLEDAKDGLGTAVLTLEKLGLTVDDFKGKTPEEAFGIFADAINKVPDALTQSALAQDLFGRSGTQLLPMLQEGSAGMREWAAEAQRLGIVLDQESAAKAELYTDTMDELKKSFRGVIIEIGPLIADVLIPFAKQVTVAVGRVVEWINANPVLGATLVKVVGTIGIVLTALGPLLIMLPGIVTAVKLVIAAFSALAAGISAPVLAVVAAIAAAVALIIAYWDEIVAGLEWLRGKWAEVWNGLPDVVKNAVNAVTWPIRNLIDLLIGAIATIARFGQALFGMRDFNDVWIRPEEWESAKAAQQAGLAQQGFRGNTAAGGNQGAGLTTNNTTTNAPNISITISQMNANDQAQVESVSQTLAEAVSTGLQGLGMVYL